MLLLAVIGLASAAIIRNAVSGDQAANGNRLQTQAGQYAQLALRFCEAQLGQSAATRVVALRAVATPAAWTSQRRWTSRDADAAHTLAAGEIGGVVQPRVAPQCLMEATAVAGVYTLTARGFSADFQADPTTGATRNGSAAWLQATIFATGNASAANEANASAETMASGNASAGPLIVRQRLWQQLLTPPF